MTTEEIDHAIGTAIDELKETGQPLSKNRIAAKVPHDRNVTLKRIDAVLARQQLTHTDSTAADRLREVQQAHRETVARLQTLGDQLHGGGVLTIEQEVEQIALERRLQNLERAVDHWSTEAARVQATMDVETVQGLWGATVEAKLAAYAHLVQAFEQIQAALDAVLETHTEQEMLTSRLPRKLRERLDFIDVNTMRLRIASRVPKPTVCSAFAPHCLT
jgi:hypothetical protein